MRASAPGVSLSVLCLVLIAPPTSARAQDRSSAAPGVLPEITYDAPASCPGRAEFERRLRARVRRDPETPDGMRATLRRIEVRIELRAGRALGQLAMRDAGGTAALRRIEAASCLEAVDALALIVALTLDPGSAAEPGSESRSTVESGSTPQRTRPADARAATDARAAAERSPRERTPAAEPTPRPSDARPAAEPSEVVEPAAQPTDAQPSEDRASVDEPLPTSRGAGIRAGLFTSAVALTGIAPRALPALQLTATLAISPAGALELAARAGARLAPDQSTTSAQGVATFAFWTSLASLCSGARSDAHHASLWLCADFELGRMGARGTDTLNANTSRRTWTALGPALVAHWDGLDPVVIQAGAELLFALVRDRFLIGGDVVHRVPPLGFRAELGVGIQLR